VTWQPAFVAASLLRDALALLYAPP
jgi:hypothetical protein